MKKLTTFQFAVIAITLTIGILIAIPIVKKAEGSSNGSEWTIRPIPGTNCSIYEKRNSTGTGVYCFTVCPANGSIVTRLTN